MNGRIYDPKLGRMLQADPFIQAPKNSQSLNRYTYVYNNPLSYTDPSGYFSLSKFVKKYWRVIVAAVATYVTWGAASTWAAGFTWGSTAGTAATLTAAGGAFAGAITGAVAGAILTGTVKGAFYGALTGAALGGIGASGLNDVGKSVASGAANGVATELQGGRFGHGFLSAGAGFWTGLKFGGAPNFGKFLGSAIAGGTISAVTGGKFSNGAISAGLAYVVAAAGATSSRNRDGGTTVSDGTSPEENFAKAKKEIINALKSGRLRLGVDAEEIVGGFDGIEINLVFDIEGAVADVHISYSSYLGKQVGGLTVSITVDYEGAITLREAYTSIGHEIRHTSRQNRGLSDIDPDGPGPMLPPQELDAERYGRYTATYFLGNG